MIEPNEEAPREAGFAEFDALRKTAQ